MSLKTLRFPNFNLWSLRKKTPLRGVFLSTIFSAGVLLLTYKNPKNTKYGSKNGYSAFYIAYKNVRTIFL